MLGLCKPRALVCIDRAKIDPRRDRRLEGVCPNCRTSFGFHVFLGRDCHAGADGGSLPARGGEEVVSADSRTRVSLGRCVPARRDHGGTSSEEWSGKNKSIVVM